MAAIAALAPDAALGAPLQYLSGAGVKAGPVVWLTWGVLIVSLLVTLVIGLLLAAAIWRRPGQSWTPGARTALQSEDGGLNWLWIGVGASALILLGSVIWTVIVLAGIEGPPVVPAVTIEVTGRQWWWQVRYVSADPGRAFVTANEIHIPAGLPVRLKLVGGDVIHSFWVPQLAGKMDAIPGQINETWIEASKPGTYRGQCTEYCGVQHAGMAFLVVAQAPADFQAWMAHQWAAPAAPRGDAARGQAAFLSHCGGCHAVRGTKASGTLGPDLSHLMQRKTLASAILSNDAATLAHWIADPQRLKPGNRMPAVPLSQSERSAIQAYLATLD